MSENDQRSPQEIAESSLKGLKKAPHSNLEPKHLFGAVVPLMTKAGATKQDIIKFKGRVRAVLGKPASSRRTP